LDAGAPIQLLLDAPGPPSLSFGVRLDDSHIPLAIQIPDGLADDSDTQALMAVARAIDFRPSSDTFGVWLLRDAEGASLVADVRAASGQAALQRFTALLSSAARARAERWLASLDGAVPWAVAVNARGGRVHAVHLRWSLRRGVAPATVTRAFATEGAWGEARAVFEQVLGEAPTEHSRPWQIATRLDEEGPVCIATSAWARRLDTEVKRARLVSAFEQLGGPSRQVDATWRLLRQQIPPNVHWMVGRGLEVRVGGGEPLALRAVLVPATH